MKKLHKIVCVVVLLAACLAPSARAAEAVKPYDQWFSVLLENQPAGWMHVSITQAKPGGPVVTAQDIEIAIKRGRATVVMKMGSKFTESADGKPVSASSTQKLGFIEIKQAMKFGPDGVEVTATQGGATRTFKAQPGDDWMTPMAMSRHIEAQIAKGAKTITVRTIDALVGPQPMELTMKLLGEEKVETLGKVVPAFKWESTTSLAPQIKTLEYVDHRGKPIKSTVTLMPGMEMVILASDKALATAKVNPPELLADTLVQLDRPIPKPRRLRAGVYELRFKGKGKAPQLPSTGYQRVAWGDERTARVVVDLDNPVAPGKDLPTGAHRSASIAIDSEDKEVLALVAKALGDPAKAKAMTPSQKAEKLRAFVHDYIEEKDLSVGFATASEVARTRQGDCTEHGVLLAAMLRAAGIPSRTVSGLVYVGRFAGKRSVFGYHMWTQAWLGGAGDQAGGGRWVDLDAAIPGEGPNTEFDATHITLATSAMADDSMMNDMVAMAGTIGALTIEVIEPKGKK